MKENSRKKHEDEPSSKSRAFQVFVQWSSARSSTSPAASVILRNFKGEASSSKMVLVLIPSSVGLLRFIHPPYKGESATPKFGPTRPPIAGKRVERYGTFIYLVLLPTLLSLSFDIRNASNSTLDTYSFPRFSLPLGFKPTIPGC